RAIGGGREQELGNLGVTEEGGEMQRGPSIVAERVHRGSRRNQLLDAIEFSGCARFEQRERGAAGNQQIRDLFAAVVHGCKNRAFIFLGTRVDEGGIGRDQLFHTTKLSCLDRLEELGFVRVGHCSIVSR